MTKEDFVKTFWYRLLQVIFVGLFSVVMGFTILVFTENVPKTYIDDEKSSITCILGDYDGNTYDLRRNGIYTYSWDGGNGLSSTGKIDAKKLCAYNKLYITFDTSYPEPSLTNYRLNIVYKTDSSWEQAFGYSTLYVGGVILIFWFIKRLIFFVSFGESILRKPKKLFD